MKMTYKPMEMDNSHQPAGIGTVWQCFQVSNNIQPTTLGLGHRREFGSEDFRVLDSGDIDILGVSEIICGVFEAEGEWCIHSILIFTRWEGEVKVGKKKKMKWLDFVYCGDDGFSCFHFNHHIFSDGPVLLNCVGEDSWESPPSKEIQPVHPKGDQSWIFIGRTDAEAETPIVWPPDAKNWLIWKDPDAGKDWRWEEKGTTEDEMVGWRHQLDGHEFE